MYLMHNILGNLWYLISTETSIRNLVLSSVMRPGWRFCAVCEANAPPRAFHCNICSICILRRDHHCAFAGKCVGYFNFRYFVGLLLHIGLGAAYASALNSQFIWHFLGGFNFLNFFKHLFPMIFWLFGRIPTEIAFWTMISIIDVCGSMFALGLLLYHSQLLMVNQTNHEKNKNITAYDLHDWKVNVEEVLGDNWKWTLFSPFVTSKLPRDGIRFPTYREYHVSANKSK
jgi:palmitoyltransferase